MIKDKWLKIRISREEDEQLRKLAATRKMTISQFVRERIFTDTVSIPVIGKIKA